MLALDLPGDDQATAALYLGEFLRCVGHVGFASLLLVSFVVNCGRHVVTSSRRQLYEKPPRVDDGVWQREKALRLEQVAKRLGELELASG